MNPQMVLQNPVANSGATVSVRYNIEAWAKFCALLVFQKYA